jgi:hypothetical protein
MASKPSVLGSGTAVAVKTMFCWLNWARASNDTTVPPKFAVSKYPAVAATSTTKDPTVPDAPAARPLPPKKGPPAPVKVTDEVDNVRSGSDPIKDTKLTVKKFKSLSDTPVFVATRSTLTDEPKVPNAGCGFSEKLKAALATLMRATLRGTARSDASRMDMGELQSLEGFLGSLGGYLGHAIAIRYQY